MRYTELEYFTYQKRRKDGKLGAFRVDVVCYTPLLTCDLCGVTRTPKWVYYRNDVYRTELWDGTPLLCTGCWNKVRAFLRAWDELKALRKIVKILRRRKL